MSLKVVAPAFCAPRMIGSTLAANLSASVATASSALLRATESLGLTNLSRSRAVASLSRSRMPGATSCGFRRPSTRLRSGKRRWKP
jgi:hypothetical protein